MTLIEYTLKETALFERYIRGLLKLARQATRHTGRRSKGQPRARRTSRR